MRRTTYQSFMLRMECVEQPDEDECWHSEVKHIQSGAEYRFDSIDSLLAFLRCQTGFSEGRNIERKKLDPPC